MTKNYHLLSILLAGLLALPGCYKIPQYRTKPLNCMYERFSHQETQNNVFVQIKRLNENEKNMLFGQRGVWLYDTKTYQPIYPIHISVHNMSDTVYKISPRNIDLKLTPYPKVAHCMKTSSFTRGAKTYVVGQLILSAICIPCIVLNNQKEVPPILRYSINLAAFGTLFSTIFVTLRNAWINTKIKHDLKEKTLHDTQLIYPGQQVDTLVFVQQSNFHNNFTLRLDNSADTKNNLLFTITNL